MNRFSNLLGKGAERALSFGVEAVAPIAEMKTGTLNSTDVSEEANPYAEWERFAESVDQAIESRPERTEFIGRVEDACYAGRLSLEQATDYVAGPDRDLA